jgi:hypothetical protein
MMNHRHGVWLSLVLIAGLALAGCGKGASGGRGGPAFDSAPAEIKAVWEKAVADDKANNYESALLGYQQILLRRDQLSPAQAKAATEASANLYQRVAEARDKGDEAAKQALAAVNGRSRGQPPSR